MWSHSGRSGFLAITIHWLTENFEMDSASFLDPETTIYHGAEQIGEMVRKVLNLLGISLEEVLAATSDRGGNVVNAVELLGLPWVPCLAHAIHNAVVTVLRNDPEAQRVAELTNSGCLAAQKQDSSNTNSNSKRVRGSPSHPVVISPQANRSPGAPTPGKPKSQRKSSQQLPPPIDLIHIEESDHEEEEKEVP
uniref:DUF659 domain-containing protein n=1 Tax=Chromera velia CCMP2878 TaxID=1169474 RepID=A0A0G4HES9_9ALVE|eukprot:Cvel_26689.t1-p1 / transcript=Cvel_26689.t1 / gene=Cvel_26689 / organism=Chromera_velia_CCMP2878 / gene_product=hypothetical protein / transcript_product=hypothetical protein / location=Cvel_scaffold3215:9408-9983(-) / protein_length=192 / sequence_SO=supercontig / SO=protein_coding / is_pseudo=false